MESVHEVENVSIKIKVGKQETLLLQAIYRSPNSSDTALDDLKKIFEDNTQYTYKAILGDFNFREINRENESTTTNENHLASRFIELCRDNYLTQHVTQHTRFRENCQPSTLDLILTNTDFIIGDIDYLEPLGSSDHIVLSFELNVNSVHNADVRSKPLYFKANYELINNKIKDINWATILEEKSMEEAWTTFRENISKIVEENVPERIAKGKTKYYQTPWMNSQTKEAIRRKKKAWRKLIYCPNTYNHYIYRKVRNEASSAVKLAKKEHEQSIAKNIKKDPKSFWRYVKSKTKIKESIPNLNSTDNMAVDDLIGKTTLLNNYFVSVFTKEDLTVLPTFEERNYSTTLNEIHFQEEEVLQTPEMSKSYKISRSRRDSP
ncbi:hypothetical protein FSP39_003028 [Pinctada imbricata]|uniref:Endonuclease/exonuclease/phosphatase domain-containing protein n=1 Tax=Pinctada imbricata TaxID=66713 RepID=A0AA88YDF0_PINIB|nr:hypothetical protein FSP39_003028 [Pinctada imbricata]